MNITINQIGAVFLGVKANGPVDYSSDHMKQTSQLRGALVGGLKLRGLSYAGICILWDRPDQAGSQSFTVGSSKGRTAQGHTPQQPLNRPALKHSCFTSRESPTGSLTIEVVVSVIW